MPQHFLHLQHAHLHQLGEPLLEVLLDLADEQGRLRIVLRARVLGNGI